MNAATKAYLLYNSPLKTRRGKITLAVILLLVFAFAVLGRLQLSTALLLRGYAWMAYTTLGEVATFLLLGLLDRKRAFVWFRLLVVATVALQTAFVALYFNTKSPISLQTVGYIEEFVKILPALLLAIFVPNLIRTRKDGMLYGAMGGIGFNIIETSLYIVEYHGSIHDAVMTHSTRFGILGFGDHIIWSTFIGLGLGMAAESGRSGWAKWKPFVLCYLLIATVHSAFDTFLTGIALIAVAFMISVIRGLPLTINAVNLALPGPIREAAIVEPYIYSIVFIVIIVRQMLWSAKSEQSIYVAQLSEEPTEVVSAEERAIVAQEGRWSFRRYPKYPRDISRKIVKFQNFLAIQKHVLAQEGKPVDSSEEVRLLRQEIAAQKSAQIAPQTAVGAQGG